MAGALAVDFICDYAPSSTSVPAISPALRTSNPARISQSLGGVAHNVAKAVHYMGIPVRLCSAVGDDLTGRAALADLSASGLRTRDVQILEASLGCRTAQYIAFNDVQKDLIIAMADMTVLENLPTERLDLMISSVIEDKPRWLVLDANWTSEQLRRWLERVRMASPDTSLIFEPVSAPKSTRLFHHSMQDSFTVFPSDMINVCTPNALELIAMYTAAKDAGLFDSQEWWGIIDSLGIPSSGARTKMSLLTSTAHVDQGLAQMSVQLLPFIRCITVKLGKDGVLVTMLLAEHDPALTQADSAPYILSRGSGQNGVGGVYMRLFPAAENVPQSEITSVNGVGDTFLGALVAGLPEGVKVLDKLEEAIDRAQRASVLTLKSHEAVSPELKQLR